MTSSPPPKPCSLWRCFDSRASRPCYFFGLVLQTPSWTLQVTCPERHAAAVNATATQASVYSPEPELIQPPAELKGLTTLQEYAAATQQTEFEDRVERDELSLPDNFFHRLSVSQYLNRLELTTDLLAGYLNWLEDDTAGSPQFVQLGRLLRIHDEQHPPRTYCRTVPRGAEVWNRLFDAGAVPWSRPQGLFDEQGNFQDVSTTVVLATKVPVAWRFWLLYIWRWDPAREEDAEDERADTDAMWAWCEAQFAQPEFAHSIEAVHWDLLSSMERKPAFLARCPNGDAQAAESQQLLYSWRKTVLQWLLVLSLPPSVIRADGSDDNIQIHSVHYGALLVLGLEPTTDEFLLTYSKILSASRPAAQDGWDYRQCFSRWLDFVLSLLPEDHQSLATSGYRVGSLAVSAPEPYFRAAGYFPTFTQAETERKANPEPDLAAAETARTSEAQTEESTAEEPPLRTDPDVAAEAKADTELTPPNEVEVDEFRAKEWYQLGFKQGHADGGAGAFYDVWAQSTVDPQTLNPVAQSKWREGYKKGYQEGCEFFFNNPTTNREDSDLRLARMDAFFDLVRDKKDRWDNAEGEGYSKAYQEAYDKHKAEYEQQSENGQPSDWKSKAKVTHALEGPARIQYFSDEGFKDGYLGFPARPPAHPKLHREYTHGYKMGGQEVRDRPFDQSRCYGRQRALLDLEENTQVQESKETLEGRKGQSRIYTWVYLQTYHHPEDRRSAAWDQFEAQGRETGYKDGLKGTFRLVKSDVDLGVSYRARMEGYYVGFEAGVAEAKDSDELAVRGAYHGGRDGQQDAKAGKPKSVRPSPGSDFSEDEALYFQAYWDAYQEAYNQDEAENGLSSAQRQEHEANARELEAKQKELEDQQRALEAQQKALEAQQTSTTATADQTRKTQLVRQRSYSLNATLRQVKREVQAVRKAWREAAAVEEWEAEHREQRVRERYALPNILSPLYQKGYAYGEAAGFVCGLYRLPSRPGDYGDQDQDEATRDYELGYGLGYDQGYERGYRAQVKVSKDWSQLEVFQAGYNHGFANGFLGREVDDDEHGWFGYCYEAQGRLITTYESGLRAGYDVGMRAAGFVEEAIAKSAWPEENARLDRDNMAIGYSLGQQHRAEGRRFFPPTDFNDWNRKGYGEGYIKPLVRPKLEKVVKNHCEEDLELLLWAYRLGYADSSSRAYNPAKSTEGLDERQVAIATEGYNHGFVRSGRLMGEDAFLSHCDRLDGQGNQWVGL